MKISIVTHIHDVVNKTSVYLLFSLQELFLHNHPPYGIKNRCNEEMLVYLYRPADMIIKLRISFMKDFARQK